MESSVDDVLEFLRRNGFRDAERALAREANMDSGRSSMTDELLAVRMSSDDEPFAFEEKYAELVKFVDTSLDIYKLELAALLYPVFVQLYLRLVAGSHLPEALKFMQRFGPNQDSIYQEDISSLDLIRTPNDLGVGNEEMRRTGEAQHNSEHLFRQFHRSNYGVSMSRETHDYLQRHFLRERSLQTIHSIITEHLDIEVFDGPPRNQLMLECRRGAFFGESSQMKNRTRILFGPLREQDQPHGRGGGSASSLPSSASSSILGGGDADDDEDTGAGPRKKKARKDGLSGGKGAGGGGGMGGGKASEANSPGWERIPLPQLKDADRLERRSRQKELEKRLRLGPKVLPPVCLYTVTNAATRGGCPVAVFSEDATRMAAGFEDGNIRVWSLTREPLRSLRSVAELERLSCDDPRVTERMLNADEVGGIGGGLESDAALGGGIPTSSTTSPTGPEVAGQTGTQASLERTLLGHSGSVYGLDISPDRQLLVSGGYDGDIRLWSLFSFSCLWVRREHRLPVWAVSFGPYGHYMATGGQDGIGRVWSTDHNSSLRLLTGHWSDVTAVQFHPNSNYVATGSDDRGVRLFDLREGNCVRTYCGHKGSPQSLTFSPCGRYLISGCDGGQVCIWDLASGHQAAYLRAHVHGRGTTAVQLCRDGNLLATAGLDGSLRMWDFRGIMADHSTKKASGAGMHHSSVLVDGKSPLLLSTFYTKKTPILSLSFNRCNVLMSSGPFGQE